MLSVRTYTGGGRSVRDYAASLGTDPRNAMSFKRLVGADLLHRRWHALGSDVRVGPPVADVAFAGGRYSRQYSGGRLSVAAGSEQVLVDEAYDAVVYLAGIQCIQRGGDQAGAPDNEIYLIVTAIDGSNIVVNGPSPTVNSVATKTFEGVNGGDWIGIGQPIWAGRNPASLTFSLELWEEDQGDKKEAREAVQDAVRKAAPIVALVAGAATGDATAFMGQLPLVDKLTESVAGLVRDIFGLKDDRIGSGTKHLDYNELHAKQTPVNPITDQVPTKTRGIPITIGDGPKTGIFKIHFYWETKPATHFE
jgi:hypothetical protein